MSCCLDCPQLLAKRLVAQTRTTELVLHRAHTTTSSFLRVCVARQSTWVVVTSEEAWGIGVDLNTARRSIIARSTNFWNQMPRDERKVLSLGVRELYTFRSCGKKSEKNKKKINAALFVLCVMSWTLTDEVGFPITFPKSQTICPHWGTARHTHQRHCPASSVLWYQAVNRVPQQARAQT